MPCLHEVPFCGLPPSFSNVVAPKPPGNLRASRHESYAPPTAHVAAARLTSIAPPTQRAPWLVIYRRDNRKAYRDSLRGNPRIVRPSIPACNDEVGGRESVICSLRRRQYSRSGVRKRSERGAAPRSDLA